MRLPQLFGIGLLTLALLVGGGLGQDKKDADKKEEKKKDDKKPDDKKKDDGKKKDGLPPGFKGIELTKEQKEQIDTVRKEYKPKLDDAAKQLNQLKKKELGDILKVLTPEQRRMFDENTAKKKADKKPDDKKPDDKKPDDKKKDDKKPDDKKPDDKKFSDKKPDDKKFDDKKKDDK